MPWRSSQLSFFKCDSIPQGKRQKGSVGRATRWWWLKSCDLQDNAEHNIRQQINRGNAYKVVVHVLTQVLVSVYLLLLEPLFTGKGQKAEEVLWNESFGYFSNVILSVREERHMGSREARGGNLWGGSCSPEIAPLCRAQSGATTSTHFGVTVTFWGPDPCCPGCKKLFCY